MVSRAPAPMAKPSKNFVAVLTGPGPLARVDQEEVRAQFRQAGVVLLRGFEAGVEDFRAFSAQLSHEFVMHPNLSRERYGDSTLMGVTPGDGHFFAHAELAYSPFRPDVAWFYCERAPTQGGETTVCDGVEVLGRLQKETRQALEQKRIRYESSYAKQTWLELAPDLPALRRILEKFDPAVFSYEVDAQEVLRYRFVSPAIAPTRFGGHLACCNSLLDSLTPRFEDGSEIPKAVLHDFIVTTEEVTVPIKWQPGDILMIDNSRVMHGRRAFKDANRKILARFARIDF